MAIYVSEKKGNTERKSSVEATAKAKVEKGARVGERKRIKGGVGKRTKPP